MRLDRMVWNGEVGAYDVGVVGDEVVAIIPMIYNHRVTIGPVDDRTGYDHGWCYPSQTEAIIAVAGWDPGSESEPVGYIKRATPGRRAVPTRGAI